MPPVLGPFLASFKFAKVTLHAATYLSPLSRVLDCQGARGTPVASAGGGRPSTSRWRCRSDGAARVASRGGSERAARPAQSVLGGARASTHAPLYTVVGGPACHCWAGIVIVIVGAVDRYLGRDSVICREWAATKCGLSVAPIRHTPRRETHTENSRAQQHEQISTHNNF